MKILKIIILIFNIAALLLLLGSTAAGLVPPSRFMGFSLLSYAYLYLLIINVVFIVLWLLLSSKWFLLSLAGIVLRYSFLPLYFQVGGTEAAPDEVAGSPEVLKVMTYNVHHCVGTGLDSKVQKSRIDSNMVELLRIVGEEKPDVISIQEFRKQGDTVNLVNRMKGLGYKYIAVAHGVKDISDEVVFSRVPIVDTVTVDGHSKYYVNLLVGGDTVHLYNLHLNSYGLDEKDQKNIHDISHGNVDSLAGRSTIHKFTSTILAHEKEWGILKASLESHGGRVVVTGDFNETPASYFYQQCRRLLVDSYCEVGQGFSTTYHGSFTRQRTGTFPAFRIDLILHSADIKALSYKRIKSDVSDHYPVIVELKL